MSQKYSSKRNGARIGLKIARVFVPACILYVAGTSAAALSTDVNRDGTVNFSDFAVFAEEWLHDSNQAALRPKYQTAFPSLGIIRDSVAYDAEMLELPPNVGRHEDICVASRPTVLINTKVSRLVQDIDGDLIICSDYLPVYTTTDGENFTRLFDISTHEDFIGYYEPNDHVRSVKVLDDGSWLLSFGVLSLGRAGKRGHLFRSVDKGLNWTHVLEYERGYTPYWGWTAVSDNEIATGEYGYRWQMDNPRRVYYSDDYGATWSKIWEPPPAWGQHIHLVAFPPGRTDALYVSSGDRRPSNKVVKLLYSPGPGGKRNIDNWSEAPNSPILARENNPVCAFSDGEYLYLGHDGYISPVLWRLDPRDDSVTAVLDWPRNHADPNVPYEMDSARVCVFSMLMHDGTYYAAIRDASDDYSLKTGAGIYVSPDGAHWTCAYRAAGVEGFHNIVGYANGFLWGTFFDANARRIYRMSPFQARLVKASRVERAVSNCLDTPASSSFEGGHGGWGPRSASEDLNYALTGVCDDMAVHGTSSYRIVVEDKGYGKADICSPYCPVNPAPGDYICASFWVRAAPTLPTGYLGLIKLEAAAGSIETLNGWFNVMHNEGWARKTIWGRCPADSLTNGVRLSIGLRDSSYAGYYANTTCYFDCVQIVYFNDLHYCGSWQLGGELRADEQASGSLVGLGPEFTTTFEWRPEHSRREWHGDIPIASWTDGRQRVDLYYDNIASRFVATDGTNTAAAAAGFYWEKLDNIKFAFTNMSGDFRLSVLTPLNGVDHALTDNLGTRLGRPIAIKLGTNSAAAGYGCGLFASIKHYDSALTAPQIEVIFELLEPTCP